MHDPHVESLFHRIEHANDVDYVKAPPLEHQEPGFNIRIENARVRIDMRDHYAAVQEARATVEPFLRAWELAVALKLGPGEFQFVYDRANVVDRNPTPGALHAVDLVLSGTGFMSPPACMNTAQAIRPRRLASRATLLSI